MFEVRSKSVQKWIDSDPLRAKWWANACPNADDGNDGHWLAFHYRRGSLSVIDRVRCMNCGVLEVA